MALKGSLKEFGASEIFQLVAQQQKSGVLAIASGPLEIRVSFSAGRMVRAEISEGARERDILGQMLVRSGALTAGELKTAEAAREKTLKPIEDILMEEGFVGADALKKVTALRNKETIARVLSLKDGQYEFKPDDVGVDTRIEEPLAVESVLMDAVRAIDEWPSVQEVITFYNMTFKAADTGVTDAAMDPDEKQVWAMLAESPGIDVQKVI
ncbi:MAG: DUF4388 domain-containing protein, partial [Myxococcota bacterium]